MTFKIKTIGYQKELFENFKKTVKDALVMDVRRFSQSRFKPQFSKKYLSENLPHYWHDADLGPPPEILKKYKAKKDWNGFATDYKKYLNTKTGKYAIKRCIIKIKNEKEVYLMCYEKYDEKGRPYTEDNVKCHRRLLKEELLKLFTINS